MPRTFALCFVHDLNPDKCTPDKCTTRISAHVLQAPCATFVCNCTRISAQRDSPPKCQSPVVKVGCVTKQYQHQSTRLSIYTVSANCCNLCILSEKREENWGRNYALRSNPDKCINFSCRIDMTYPSFTVLQNWFPPTLSLTKL